MDNDVLRNIALSYSPMVGRNRAVLSTRLTVSAVRAAHTPKADELLAAIAEVWPEGGTRVSLNITSETLLNDLLRASPMSSVMLELPSFIACDPANTEVIAQLADNGNTLLLQGRPPSLLPRRILPCFKYSIIELADDRRATEAPGRIDSAIVRSMRFIQSGVRTVAEMEGSFARGALGVLGWPIDDLRALAGSRPGESRMTLIGDLFRRIDDADAVANLTAALERDSALAGRLMRYLTSPAFGLSSGADTLREAAAAFGGAHLKRCVALLLATASRDPQMRPVMYAAVRRGIFMEQLVAHAVDQATRSDVFICGVFSLLDIVFNRDFPELLARAPVSERVREALIEDAGPYHPYLVLARAVESNSVDVIDEYATALQLGLDELNRALLATLTMASQLE